jgi:hypothetical protein
VANRAPSVVLPGMRFGKLTVVEFSHSDGKKRFFRCKCECGKTTTTRGCRLTSLKSPQKSCGCAGKETNAARLALKVDTSDRVLRLYRRGYSALLSRHNKRWDTQAISFDEYKALVSRPCVYCSHPGSNTLKDRDQKGGVYSDTILKINGVDRIDSNYGYTTDNTNPVCGYCNTSKLDKPEAYFLQWVKQVYEHLGLNHLDKSESMEYSGPNTHKKEIT